LVAAEPFAGTSQIFAARVLLVALAVRWALAVAQVLLGALAVRWALAAAPAWPAVLYRNSVAASVAGLALGLDLAWCPDSALDSGSDLVLYPDLVAASVVGSALELDLALYRDSAAALGAGWALAMDLALYPDLAWCPDSALD